MLKKEMKKREVMVDCDAIGFLSLTFVRCYKVSRVLSILGLSNKTSRRLCVLHVDADDGPQRAAKYKINGQTTRRDRRGDMERESWETKIKFEVRNAGEWKELTRDLKIFKLR